jgi:hypothetical protein
VQVHGGMGFVEETGAAQHYRDARIAPIYEGANGVQALDLVGRKLSGDGGAAMAGLIAEMRGEADAPLMAAVDALESATAWLLAHPGPDAQAGATAYLKLAGDTIGGWALARQARVAGEGDDWARGKTALYRLYASQVLSGALGLSRAVSAGAGELRALGASALH